MMSSNRGRPWLWMVREVIRDFGVTVGCVERSWSVWAEDVQVQVSAAVCAGGPGRQRQRRQAPRHVCGQRSVETSKLYLRAHKNKFKVENDEMTRCKKAEGIINNVSILGLTLSVYLAVRIGVESVAVGNYSS